MFLRSLILICVASDLIYGADVKSDDEEVTDIGPVHSENRTDTVFNESENGTVSDGENATQVNSTELFRAFGFSSFGKVKYLQ
jgi:hypothetical protein